MFNWSKVTRFNFTYAINGGAWLEDSSGNVQWFSYSMIVEHLGKLWWDRQREKQGWMTGCWVDVESPSPMSVG